MINEQESNVAKAVKAAVMRRVVESGAFVIPDISADTGLSVTTVSKYVSQMVENGEIEALEVVSSDKRGRRPVLYGVRSDTSRFACVDVRQYGVSYGLMDISGKMIAEYSDSEFVYENSPARLEELCVGLESFVMDRCHLTMRNIRSVCFCLGGRINTFSGTSASKFTLESLADTPLAEYLTERLGTDVFVENDTKAMTYGEYLSLGNRTWKNVLFVNIGWGLGIGIVIDGKLYYGKDGYSGELGHAPIYDNDIICHCGKKGCLETEVSGSAIHRRLLERIKGGESSRLSPKYYRGEMISLSDIMSAAGKEDPLCVDLITKVGTELGRSISMLINVFSPDCIILGGDVSQAASYYFLYPLQASVRKYSLRLISQNLPFVTSRLGDRAAIYGGCMLARNRHFTSEIHE